MNDTKRFWWGTNIRFLFFAASDDELKRLDWRHLTLGVLCAWLVGMGRHWDNPLVEPVVKTGIFSVAYVFFMAAWLYAFMDPMGPRNWTYFRVATMVAMTAPPGLLYAIPVEQYYDFETAANLNLRFLVIVSIWRVLLLLYFVMKTAEIGFWRTIAGSAFPITIIIFFIFVLNLEKAIFVDRMMGLRPRATTQQLEIADEWPGIEKIKAGDLIYDLEKDETKKIEFWSIITVNDKKYEFHWRFLMVFGAFALPLFVAYIVFALTATRSEEPAWKEVPLEEDEEPPGEQD